MPKFVGVRTLLCLSTCKRHPGYPASEVYCYPRAIANAELLPALTAVRHYYATFRRQRYGSACTLTRPYPGMRARLVFLLIDDRVTISFKLWNIIS